MEMYKQHTISEIKMSVNLKTHKKIGQLYNEDQKVKTNHE